MRTTLHIWIVVFFSTTSAWADTGLTRGPYLQQGSPTEMTLIWRTHRPSNPAVRFGPVAGETGQRVDGEAIVVRVSPDSKEPPDLPRLHSAPPGTYQYEARLTGLEPNTLYYYEVLDGSQVLMSGPEYYFETSPQKGDVDLTGIWVVGDSGTGAPEAASVYKSMREYTALKSFSVDLMLHLGDMAYGSGHDHEFQRNFFDLYQPTLRHTVCWPTMGNHEGQTSSGKTGVGPYYDAYVVPTQGESGGIPSGTESYYSFDYGRIHFVVLNSFDMDRRPDKPMAQWLKRDLAAVKDMDWIVAFCHHPPYTMGTHNSNTEREHREIREHIMPILEEGGVDLVLGGHSHIYERSMLIDGAYETPTRAEGVVLDDGDGSPDGDGPYRKSAGINGREGVIAIVAGNGGGGIRQLGTMPVMRKAIVKFGSNLLSFNGDTMEGLMLSTNGEVLDTFSIVKKGKVTPVHIGHPWQPLRPPEIEPVMPAFDGSVSVTIRSPTQWPFEEIHYTLDGSMPTLESPIYTGPLTITNHTVVLARTFEHGGERISPPSRMAYHKLAPPEFLLGTEAEVLEAGLFYRYYEGRWNRLPDFNTLKPVATGVATHVTLDARKRENDYAMTFDTYLQIPEEDTYTFHLTSDDGSRLRVGGVVVVNNDGSRHNARTRVGTAPLVAGWHNLRIEFFDAAGAGPTKLELLYHRPGEKPRPIPASAWGHQ